MTKKILFCFFAFFSFLSCSNNQNAIAVSDWRILYSQTEDIEVAADSENWIDLDIRKPISLPYPQEQKFQYLWIKGHFAAPEDYTCLYGITVARISMADRIYINGKLIGYVNEEELKSLDGPRNYPIPSGTIQEGDNSLFIRVGTYDDWDPEISENIQILNEESFHRMRNLNHLLSEILPMSILTLIIGTFFSLLFKSANENWNKEYLIITFRLLIVILCFLTFYSPIPLFSIRIILAIWHMALPLILISMVLLYQEIARIRFEKLNLFTIPFLAGISAAVFVFTLVGFSAIISQTLIGLAFTVSLTYILYILLKILKNRQHGFTLVLIISDAFIIILNIINVILFLVFDQTVLDPSLLSILSGLSLTIIYSIYFARRDGLRKRKMEDLLERLNTIELNSKGSPKIRISSTLEKKLKEITVFIENNFTTLLTREELAETIGINPNYFSSLFNLFTGKKVNEYINDLRLEKASEVLITKNNAIIDVAFSTGFESLTTFNRLFKKKFRCTPKEFRTGMGKPEKK